MTTALRSIPIPLVSAILASLATLSLAASARASDGVFEISQICATQTGCTATDAPGFPVTITTPGAYRLTSDLVVLTRSGDVDTSLIEVGADDVDLDLNGFGLRGGASCSGTPASCTGTGDGRGIDGSGAGLSVHDGVVQGMGSHGVFASQDAHIRDVTARGNGGNGIFAGAGSLIEHVVANGNGGAGIATAGQIVVRDASARANGSLGISLQSFSQASGLIANANGSHGIAAGIASEISDCSASSNQGDGVHVFSQSSVRDCTTRSNDGAGIGASGSGNLAIGVNSAANGRYSLEGSFVYQNSYLGCSLNNFAAAEVGATSPMVDGANTLLICVVF